MAYKIYLDLMPDYQPGDPRPEGYLERQEWATVQHKAGLRQARCSRCGLWNFPQELASETPEVVCKTCDEAARVAEYHELIAAGYSDAEARGTAWPAPAPTATPPANHAG